MTLYRSSHKEFASVRDYWFRINPQTMRFVSITCHEFHICCWLFDFVSMVSNRYKLLSLWIDAKFIISPINYPLIRITYPESIQSQTFFFFSSIRSWNYASLLTSSSPKSLRCHILLTLLWPISSLHFTSVDHGSKRNGKDFESHRLHDWIRSMDYLIRAVGPRD